MERPARRPRPAPRTVLPGVALPLILGLGLAAGGSPAMALAGYAPGDAGSALDFARAVAAGEAESLLVSGAAWEVYGPGTEDCGGGPAPRTGTAAAASDARITAAFGVPDGARFGILSSGNASEADLRDAGADSCVANRARGAFDVTVLRIDLDVPPGDNCLFFSFQFLSEEYPEWIGSAFNDAFVAELGASNWALSGSTLTAPDNFAVFPGGVPATVNSLGFSMLSVSALGTPYDGASGVVLAETPLEPPGGPHSLFLSIFDASDSFLDTAVFVDGLDTVRVADVGRGCLRGIVSSPPYAVTPEGPPPPATADDDRDGIQDGADNCPGAPNREQEDADQDGVGDACAPPANPSPSPSAGPPPEPAWNGSADSFDGDADGVRDDADNCPAWPNPDQADLDLDHAGDACDADRDGDRIPDGRDLCPGVADGDQADADGDGAGDACARRGRPPEWTMPAASAAVRPQGESREAGRSVPAPGAAAILLLAAGAVSRRPR